MLSLEIVYTGCALLGGVVLILRFLLIAIGVGGHGDTGMDAPSLDAHDGGVHGGDSGGSGLNLVSVHGLTAFFLVFGLTGLTLTRGFHLGGGISILGAFAAGFCMMWVIAWMFAAMSHLQSSGNIDLRNAEGKEGAVYLTIPKDGVGKVKITVQNRLLFLDAKTSQGVDIPTGFPIRVIRLLGDDTLLVERSSP